MSICNAVQAKVMGENGITYDDAMKLVREFKLFNPYHILPENKARKYLNENWDGRLLDLRHFGLTPRKRSGGRRYGEEKKDR